MIVKPTMPHLITFNQTRVCLVWCWCLSSQFQPRQELCVSKTWKTRGQVRHWMYLGIKNKDPFLMQIWNSHWLIVLDCWCNHWVTEVGYGCSLTRSKRNPKTHTKMFGEQKGPAPYRVQQTQVIFQVWFFNKSNCWKAPALSLGR